MESKYKEKLMEDKGVILVRFMHNHFSIISVYSNKGCFLPSSGERAFLFTREIHALLSGRSKGPRKLLYLRLLQLPSAQNIPFAKAAYLGLIYSYPPSCLSVESKFIC